MSDKLQAPWHDTASWRNFKAVTFDDNTISTVGVRAALYFLTQRMRRQGGEPRIFSGANAPPMKRAWGVIRYGR